VALAPPLQAFRFPAKGLWMTGLATALLAAWGVDAIANGRRAPALVLLVLVGCELVVLNRHLLPTAPAGLYALRPAELAHIRSPAPPRLYSHDYFYGRWSQAFLGRPVPYLLSPEWQRAPGPWLEALAVRDALHPGVLPAWQVQSAFDLDAFRLYEPPLRALTLLLREAQGTPLRDRLLRTAGVSFVSALHREDLTQVSERPSMMPEPLRLYALNGALPRAWATGRVRVASNAVAALAAPDFDPFHEVVLERDVPGVAPFDPQGVEVVERRSDRVGLRAQLPADGIVVLLDGWDPGWDVFVDGTRTTPLRANGVFRAVKVGAGDHRVEWVHRPVEVRTGLAVTLASALLATGLCVRPRRPAPRCG